MADDGIERWRKAYPGIQFGYGINVQVTYSDGSKGPYQNWDKKKLVWVESTEPKEL